MNTNGELVRHAVLQWGETPYAIGKFIRSLIRQKKTHEKCIQPEQAEKKYKLRKKKHIMYIWRTKIIYMQGRSPPSTPAPSLF